MTEEKKFYIDYEKGKMVYKMVDLKSVDQYGIPGYGLTNFYSKSKPCKIVFDHKELVALNPDADRSYGFKYFYNIVEDPDKRFSKVKRHEQYINSNRLVDKIITEIKDKHV
jgi:hypothetical protein